jgi:hypothetical protein
MGGGCHVETYKIESGGFWILTGLPCMKYIHIAYHHACAQFPLRPDLGSNCCLGRRMSVCLYVCMCVYIYMYECMCVYICVCVCVWECVCVCVCFMKAYTYTSSHVILSLSANDFMTPRTAVFHDFLAVRGFEATAQFNKMDPGCGVENSSGTRIGWFQNISPALSHIS